MSTSEKALFEYLKAKLRRSYFAYYSTVWTKRDNAEYLALFNKWAKMPVTE